MAKKKTAPQKAPLRRAEMPAAYYSLHALLLSVRSIAQHEDRLCTLLHEIKRERAVSAELTAELNVLLEEMPSRDYTSDLEAAAQDLKAARKATQHAKRR